MFETIEKIEKKEIRTDIMVTVVCVTYNHENYIRDCLEGIVRQKTDFKFQVFIGDDCSTDGTRKIIDEYVNKYPDIIIPFHREENIGSIHNFGDLCERVDTKYIAFCDGDDYWIDYDKLQKQVDFLENNPDINGVSGRLRLEVPEDWFLKDYYKRNKDGYFYQPDFLPGFKMPKDNLVNINNLVANNITHACATMLRVNEEIVKLPEWFYKTYMGDTPYVMLQVGDGKLKFTDDIVGIYRKHDGGVTNSTDMDTNMMKTRIAYITYLSGVREFFIDNYKSYGVVSIENRIKQEVANYLGVLVKYKMDDKIVELFRDYPEAGIISLNAYLSFYWDSRRMTNTYTWEGNKTVARDRYFMHLFAPIVKLYNKLKKLKIKIKRNLLVRKIKNLLALIMYLLASLVPKKKNLWVFTSFKQKGYLDNSKYYFEYVTKNNPEIHAVWLTKDRYVYNDLRKHGKTVYMSRSVRGIWNMIRAKIAVTDHYRITDYPSLLGFNAKTKVVQLWHGAGFKAMGNGEKINVGFEGVEYSTDIVCNRNDTILNKFVKKYKYLRHAFYRELFEEYFLFVCPGQERIDMIGKIWGIPSESYFMAGHSRDIQLYSDNFVEDKKRILYAPTYRDNAESEEELINNFLSKLSLISKYIEKLDAEFYIRLHPYTWRNYNNKIRKELCKYENIFMDKTEDIYKGLKKFSIVVSDYSSISIDFAGIIKRPVVYYCFDYDDFSNGVEMGFNLDYFENTPGPKTYTWEDTLKEIEKYIENPQKDSKMRKEVCKYFFDDEVNAIDNSERITNEIKRRLKIK